MDTMSELSLGAAVDTSAPLQLVRAAAALRWKRPDLTATLAELALDAADDAATWVTAAGWLLHGRTVLGDGRQVACDLIDGLARWSGGGADLMTGPQGRRLRVELAGPARRAGDPAAARTLLAADPGADTLDAELHADVLTELARCAVDDAPDTADAALDAAEQAWLATGCEPGVAAVLLLRAARDRRTGRAAAAAVGACAGLARVNAGGRRAGGTGSDHLAAALTAEWIAALVDAGRVEEARNEAAPAANRLLTTARPSRQLAGLRLAVARVAAVGDTADDVLAALEPAAQDAADADVPELEAACRSMLGELHEAAGRLDAALTAVRAAMAAERRDHDRGARLRMRLAAATDTWAGSPSGHGAARQSTWGFLTDPATGRPAGTRTEADPAGVSTRGPTPQASARPERPTAVHRPIRRRSRPSGPGCEPATGAAPPVPGAAHAGSRRRPRRPSPGQRPRCPSSGAHLPSGTRRRRRTDRSRPGPVRMVRDTRERPSAPAHPGPGCPHVTSGGGTTACRRRPDSRPCPSCRRGRPRPGTAPGPRPRMRPGSTTRRPRAGVYPDVVNGPLSSSPPNPGTAGRRRTDRPAGWRTAQARARPRRAERRARRREAGRRTPTPVVRWRSAAPGAAVR